MSRQDIAALSSKSGWTDRDGKGLTQAATVQIVERLTRQNLLVRSSDNNVAANDSVEALAAQDSIRQNWFDKLRSVIQNQSTGRSYFSYHPGRYARDVHVAFYGG